MQVDFGGAYGLLLSTVYLNYVAVQETLPGPPPGDLEQESVEAGVQTDVNKPN
jgi:hypothetical protein